MISKLTLRLLVFNLLLVFFPLGAVLYLDTYERQLLDSMEHSMVQQGRLVSASLNGKDNLQEEGLRLLKNLEGHQNARIRIVDKDGALLADSSSPDLQLPVEEILNSYVKPSRIDSVYEEIPEDLRENWLYKAAVYPLNIIKRLFVPPTAPLGSAEFYSGSFLLLGPEIQLALAGKYGAFTRYSSGGQRSVNLYSALPIFYGEEVIGVVLVSRSTYKILSDLYSLRLDMVRIFIYSIIAAAILSMLLARTITIPVKKLRDQAESFLDHRGRVRGQFRSLKNRDEIGDLSRVLDGLSSSLVEYTRFMDGFSSDLSHELKNPVAAILNAAELSLDADALDQKRFTQIIQKEGLRIQRLIDDLREISHVDIKLAEESLDTVDLKALVTSLVEQRTMTEGSDLFQLDIQSAGPYYLRGSADRLIQCFSNLMDNALSFSPEGEHPLLVLKKSGGKVEVTVLDRGPGIPEGNMDKLFDRFFSDRPGSEKKKHSGLGLSISYAVVHAYRGEILVENRDGGGACFKVILPLSPL
ncbi:MULTISPECIES: ATP-binding protein [unclassified Oceanispirochaeta]|uniref:ATP-binding protein n=1 Tax=unclassified Oceanispirochaeta TaxID=2635722 RepID=UPI000E098C06|nr:MULTISPECIES: ATP-binding protein [unclassified Oceanispirochaeta]MBF9016284.1 sensor N-terminal transmembrane domain-containing protein [Oceanispirochaeta sp. M2]NPD72747.1 HAMP domain-containing protein [Oceanispirochaeta sp. M1]RDG31593.1 HAMP domain-containing protein [Oceanispirochaeta sp. M1]